MTQSDFQLILGVLADTLREQDPERIAALLAPDVVWEGARPDMRCEGRDQAMNLIRRRFEYGPVTVHAVEVVAGDDAVVVGMRGPGFNGTPGDVETVGETYNVYNLEGGLIVHWRDFLGREDALRAAGAQGTSRSTS